MNIIKHISQILLISTVPFMWGCSLFGLDVQENADFDNTTSSSYVDMTALEFIKSRPDAFKAQLSAIAYAGMEQEYNAPNRTFILLTEKALVSDTYLPSETSPLGSYFACHKVLNGDYNPSDPSQGPEFILPQRWEEYPKEQVRALLEYHILKQAVSINESMDYKIFFQTLTYKYQGDTGFVCTEWVRDRNAKFMFNNFTGHRVLNLSPRVSNIRCKNGVIHIFDDYLEAPSSDILEKYNVVY